MRAYGVTVPFEGRPLHEQRAWFEEAAALGYTDLWSSEAGGADGLTPLALAAAWVPSLRLGTAILPAFTRGPALLAMSVATMAEAAPGRFACGIGASSDIIVEGWNGIPFRHPYARTRDTVRFLRAALSGEKVTETYETFAVRGFRLAHAPAQVPPILVAALRPRMLRLAGAEADGAVVNWLSADDVATVAPHVGQGKEVVARIFVCPSEDAATVRQQARPLVAAYLNVPVYAAFHRWLGREADLGPMWEAWARGDRKAAVAAIPDQVVDDLVVHGSPAACRAHIGRYVANGVTTPVLALLPLAGAEPLQALRDLAPARP